VKLSPLPLRPHELHVLVALAGGERHGYAIQREVASRSGGAVRIGPGSLYETLARLLERELIREVRPKESARARGHDHAQRRYYSLTAKGRRVLAAEVERLDDVVRIARARLEDTEA
jgi:DNA-binding PadR family transcriptional regulator